MDPDAPLITVAIPTYNGARHVEDAVRSVLNQTGVAFDLIICDDRSSDDTVERIKVLAGDRAQVEINSERLGLAGNWNRCVERSRTPFVAIFHQDDVMLSGHLASHLAAFTDKTGLVASSVIMIDDDGRPIDPRLVEPGGCGPVERHYPPGAFLRELAVANPLRCPAVTLRKAAHEAVGGFKPSYRYAVDWAHWIAIASEWEVAWLPKTTTKMRWHIASETHRFATDTIDLDESYHLLLALYEAHPEVADLKPLAMKRLARAFLNRAYVAARAHQPGLVRKALGRALALSPRLGFSLLADPRLSGRLMLSQFVKPPK